MRETDKQKLIQDIMENVPDRYEYLITKAIEMAESYHKNEYRYSGEPFIIHALNVGRNCAQIKLDTDSIIVGLLHQITSEKFKTSQAIEEIMHQIKSNFGDEVLEIFKQVSQITKQTNLKLGSDLKVLHKYLINGVDDIRPSLIKVCDVLDDAQTCNTLSSEKLPLFTQKILNVYSPICEYFNLGEFKKIMEESVFMYNDPENYNAIKKMYEVNRIDNSLLGKYSEYFQTVVKDILGYDQKIYGRVKGLYSTFVKLQKYLKEGKTPKITDIKDLVAFTVIAQDESQCYEILHALQSFCINDPTNFDDYILIPKPNGYKAIHACIQIPEVSDIWIEIQIMTDQMHYTNTYGPASHIAYKAAKARFPKATKENNWVEKLHEKISEHINKREDRRSIPIPNDFLKNRIFVQTPNGKIIELELESTCIDFAYQIHTDVGNSAVSAVVNNIPAKLSKVLKTGDIVEIVTRKDKVKPNKEWLEFAKQLNTKKEIREALNKKGR